MHRPNHSNIAGEVAAPDMPSNASHTVCFKLPSLAAFKLCPCIVFRAALSLRLRDCGYRATRSPIRQCPDAKRRREYS
jgi:hypothetical protein